MISRNLAARLAVAAVAVPTILWICYAGGWWLYGMIALFALVGLLEYLWQEGHRPGSVFFWLGIATVAANFAALAVSLVSSLDYFGGTPFVFWLTAPLSTISLLLVAGMLYSLGSEPPARLFERYSRLIWGVVYIGTLYPFVFLLGTMVGCGGPDCPAGGDYLLFLFGLLWIGDTAAMWVGSTLGRHKLAPTVSPNKTVEGFIGGLLGALAIGVLMVFWKFAMMPWHHVLLAALGCSVFGQLGDLTEAMWKRALGIKDSSAIIPGHGGVLDRFDSLLFAAPFMYAYMYLYWS
jgi:phosphatidate cytidylyltransferase